MTNVAHKPAAETRTKCRDMASLWNPVEALLVRMGERLNPILVKETRQALKSRQFTYTFILLLAACWIWSIGGVAMIGPSIFYSAAGSEMFFGYYIILAFPLSVIVPFSAYRSLAAEQEDNTYELLTITSLSPRQIISGKLGSAVVQMIVYFSAIAPCLAFTYLLRGVDIISIGVLLTYSFFGSLGLSMIALFLATVTKEKYVQVIVSVVLVVGMAWAFIGSIALAFEFLEYGSRYLNNWEFWVVVGALFNTYVAYFALVFLAAAAQITFHSENRSTSLRVVMLLQQVCFVSWMAWGWFFNNYPNELLLFFAAVIGIHWYAMGALMSGEIADLSPRVKRRLPQSFLGRMFFTWFNPGSGTGYVFACANLMGALVIIAAAISFSQVFHLNRRSWGNSDEQVLFFSTVGLGYIVAYLGLGRLAIVSIRRFSPVNLFAGTMIHALLLLAGSGIPLIIQSMSPQLRNAGYTMLQITNPVWSTIHIVDRGSLPTEAGWMTILVLTAAAIIFLANLPSIARELRYVRIAKPQRVIEEDIALAPPPPEPEPASPWD